MLKYETIFYQVGTIWCTFLKMCSTFLLGGPFPGGTSGKEPMCQCRRHKRPGFSPWVGKIPWTRAWQPTPVFLPGESHGQRSLAGYSPWGHKESDTTEPLNTACQLYLNKIGRKIFWRKKWQPTPVFWPGKSHGQRTLAGYSPWRSQRVGHDWVTNISLSHKVDPVYFS